MTKEEKAKVLKEDADNIARDEALCKHFPNNAKFAEALKRDKETYAKHEAEETED